MFPISTYDEFQRLGFSKTLETGLERFAIPADLLEKFRRDWKVASRVKGNYWTCATLATFFS